ncbi:hypothetical protein T484DRAFT_1806793, partial [Baffinella frigidus]
VSHSSDSFPGTEARVVAISGQMPRDGASGNVGKAVAAILQEGGVAAISGQMPRDGALGNVGKAVAAILQEVYQDNEHARKNAGEDITVELLIPEMSVVLVRSGLKAILEKAGGKMDITPADSQAPGSNERIVVIQGTIKESQAPGTNERIVVIQGTIKEVTGCTDAVLQRIYEDPDCK